MIQLTMFGWRRQEEERQEDIKRGERKALLELRAENKQWLAV